MLSPDYYNEISQGAEAVAEELHENIIRKIIRRLIARMKRYKVFALSQTDKWAIETLQESGYLREDIAKEIAKLTGRQARTIRKAFEEAAVKNLEWDDAVYRAAGLSPDPLKRSPFLIRLLQRGYEKTRGEWRNYTRTTADAAQRLFISECDKAYNLVASGAESLQTAVAEAVEKIASDGVEVVYPSGHKDTIETATQRAVRTGVAQACGDITTARMDEMDWDIVLVSAHLGARVTDKEDFTNHYWWQGQFYSRSGKDPRFKPFSVCGEGNVQGILGANCRHSYSPGDGKFNPFEKFDSEENKKRYQNEQKQRSMERAIRKTKRELIGLKEGIDAAGDDEALKAELQKKYDRKAVTLKNQFDRYEEFSKENGLKMQYDRANIAGWDKSQAKAARAAEKAFTNQKDNSTIEAITGARITNPYSKRATEHANRYYDLVRKMKNDVPKIAKVSNFSEEQVENIKNYLFNDTHDLGDGRIDRFDPDFAIAQSWQRLVNATPEQHDITLLKHEEYELSLVKDGYSQNEAHILASEKYNYGKEVDEYYATLKKHKNKQ